MARFYRHEPLIPARRSSAAKNLSILRTQQAVKKRGDGLPTINRRRLLKSLSNSRGLRSGPPQGETRHRTEAGVCLACPSYPDNGARCREGQIVRNQCGNGIT
jgi:hypothetical protein